MEPNRENGSLTYALQPGDLTALGAAWQGRLSPISPLTPHGGQPVAVPPGSLLFDTTGKPIPQVTALLPLLAGPEAVSSLAAVTDSGLIDLMVYHAAGRKNAALVNTGTGLELHAPAPTGEVLEVLFRDLREPVASLPEIDLVLTIDEALLLWACVDVVRRRPEASRSSRIASEDLKAAIDQPFHELDHLAAYYRDSLLLPLPAETEFNRACTGLIEKEWIGGIGRDYLPGETLLALASSLGEIPWHTLMRAGLADPEGRAAAVQIWLLQSSQGLGLAWFEHAGQVRLFSLGRVGMMTLLEQFLERPEEFFASSRAAGSQAQAPAASGAGTGGNAPAPGTAAAAPKSKRPFWFTCGLVSLAGAALVCLAGISFVLLAGLLRNPAAQEADPLPEATRVSAPTALPAATDIPAPSQAQLLASLEFTGLTLIEDSPGNGYAVGILRNNSTYTLEGIEIDVRVLDNSAALIQQETVYPFVYQVGPGEATPFQMYYSAAEGIQAAEVQVEVSAVEHQPQQKRSVGLELGDISLFASPDGYVHLTGRMTNRDAMAMYPFVSAVLLDPQGQPLSASSLSGFNSLLGPGEETAFQVAFGPLPETLRLAPDQYSWEFFMDPRRASLPAGSPQVVLNPESHIYIDAYDGVHLIGRLTNADNQPVVVALNASLVTAQGQILSAVTSYPYPEFVPAGQEIVFDVTFWGPVGSDPALLEQAASYHLSIDQGATMAVEGARAVTLTNVTGNWQIENDYLTFQGEVENDTGGEATLYVFGFPVTGEDLPIALAQVVLYDAGPGVQAFECSVPLEPGLDPAGLDFRLMVIAVTP